MSVSAHLSILRLRGEILRSVSRSFYLSIRLLPPELRDPIALAYLLARATDTIADTVTVGLAMRMEQLANLAAAIAGRLEVSAAAGVRDAFAPSQTNPSERALIAALPECMEWLGALSDADRNDVRSVLAKINEGQAGDLRRFGGGTTVHALESASELDEYTYLVAGCVGEFWTRIGSRHLADFAERPYEEMLRLGEAFGKGLQLINILRDAGDDLRAGRCYLPADELAATETLPTELLQQPERAEAVLAVWRSTAKTAIASGIEYACAIRNRRVRFATALPALIGARTLALLETAGAKALQQKVKVSRREVRAIVSSGAITFASAITIRQLFLRLSRPAA